MTSFVPAQADETENKVNSAVANIVFDFDADSFSTYFIEGALVNISFASNSPDKLYFEVLAKLNAHPDIKDVLAGRDGPVCSAF